MDIGYLINSTNINGSPYNHSTKYYLAAPISYDSEWLSYLFATNKHFNGTKWNQMNGGSISFRPIVCLNSNVVLTKNASGSYDLSIPE